MAPRAEPKPPGTALSTRRHRLVISSLAAQDRLRPEPSQHWDPCVRSALPPLSGSRVGITLLAGDLWLRAVPQGPATALDVAIHPPHAAVVIARPASKQVKARPATPPSVAPHPGRADGRPSPRRRPDLGGCAAGEARRTTCWDADPGCTAPFTGRLHRLWIHVAACACSCSRPRSDTRTAGTARASRASGRDAAAATASRAARACLSRAACSARRACRTCRTRPARNRRRHVCVLHEPERRRDDRHRVLRRQVGRLSRQPRELPIDPDRAHERGVRDRRLRHGRLVVDDWADVRDVERGRPVPRNAAARARRTGREPGSRCVVDLPALPGRGLDPRATTGADNPTAAAPR